MAIRLVFADSDLGYAEKLSEWLQKNMPSQFTVEVMTNGESLKAWRQSGAMADLMLVSSQYYLSFPDSLPLQFILLDDGSHTLLAEDTPRILKFQQAPVLIKEILSLAAEKIKPAYKKTDHNYQITLVLYTDGDALTPAAQALALTLSRMGKHTFLLNLEENQTTDLYFQTSNNKGLKEMLYYIKSQKDNLELRLEACSSKDFNSGVVFLKAPQELLDSDQITLEDQEALLTAIIGHTYDEIIVSMDARVSGRCISLLKRANRIVFASLYTKGSSLKLHRLLQEFQRQGVEQLELQRKSRLLFTSVQENPCSFEIPLDIRRYFVPVLTSQGDFRVPSDYHQTLVSLLEDTQDMSL